MTEQILDSYVIESLINDGLKKKNIIVPIEYKEHVNKRRRARNSCFKTRQYCGRQQYWSGEGLECELLRMGDRHWQKGRFRINISFDCEFIPDEEESEIDTDQIQSDESPLDELRSKINDQ